MGVWRTWERPPPGRGWRRGRARSRPGRAGRRPCLQRRTPGCSSPWAPARSSAHLSLPSPRLPVIYPVMETKTTAKSTNNTGSESGRALRWGGGGEPDGEGFGKDMNDEEVGRAVEGDDLAFELLAEGGLHGDQHPDRELLAATLHVAAAARRWVDGRGGGEVGCEILGVQRRTRPCWRKKSAPQSLTTRPACFSFSLLFSFLFFFPFPASSCFGVFGPFELCIWARHDAKFRHRFISQNGSKVNP